MKADFNYSYFYNKEVFRVKMTSEEKLNLCFIYRTQFSPMPEESFTLLELVLITRGSIILEEGIV